MKNKKPFYLGLDIGTDSVGYAVTDKEYNLMKYAGEPAWGVTVFDAASLKADRRAFRTARRRLDRRQQRVALVQELFAEEIAKVDTSFFRNLKASALFREDAGCPYPLFNDDGFTDKDYYDRYPTVHHLIIDLMNNKQPHDIRLVYLAVSWLVAHRGHFLSNIGTDNLSDIKDFSSVYTSFINYFYDNDILVPWGEVDVDALADALKKKCGVNAKNKELTAILYGGKKPVTDEEYPFDKASIVKLFAGGKVTLKDLFRNEGYAEFGSVTLSADDETIAELAGNIGDDCDLIYSMRAVYDWTVLVDVLAGSSTISEAKVAVYDKHKDDLEKLKDLFAKYLSKQKYKEVFSDGKQKANYVAYTQHASDDKEIQGTANKEDFSKYLLGFVAKITPKPADVELYEYIKTELENRTFLPKQKNTDNRVIPHQLYEYELCEILKVAENYLPFLKTTEDGITVSEKLVSIFRFRIPYFVGPLNKNSQYAWLERVPGKIYPWNFERMVDLDASEQNFIQRMTNTCTYLPGEPVLPKDSLLYHRFSVLNEINNLKINDIPITVELKQRIYNEVFLQKKKVTRKYLCNWLIANGFIAKGEEDTVTGIDININSSLTPQIAFKSLLEREVLTEAQAEEIIERSTFAEDKTRLSRWLVKNYPNLSEDDKKYICNLKLKDFGRLSRRFLTEIYGVVDRSTGETSNIISAMWETNYNLMELLSEKFTFREMIDAAVAEYYGTKKVSVNQRLDDMYISNAVKRPVFRTLAIVNDVKKAFGTPEKIFIEMTRGATEEQKNKRTQTRKDRILELYAKCRDEDVRDLQASLEAMGDYANNRLQSEKLFLYYMQLGKCMYTGKAIDLEKLGTKEYDVDHIYPQAFVKDDSILNNKVLVLSEENGKKSNIYPISADVRHTMHSFWTMLYNQGLITEEKYKRLTRATAFTEEEKLGFISRQLVETSQSTKAVAELLKEKFPETEIVYVKARLTSDFRQEFDLLKSRSFNELHHAQDAYLNIVTGNVYNMKFTRRWFNVNSDYSIKTKTLFTHPLTVNGETVWSGEEMLAKVKKTAVKNTAHFTILSHYKNGGLFDQMPIEAAEGLVPRKADLPTEKYGGYNKSSAMFFIPVKYSVKKKTDIIIMTVEMRVGKKFLADEKYAETYTFERLQHILGKPVDSITFPLGLKPWKVNTVLSLDGFRICIPGSGSGGKCLVASSIMQFTSGYEWQYYLKKVEMLVEKYKANPNYHYDARFDVVTKEQNIALYDIYIEKYNSSIMQKRVNNPVVVLNSGKALFENLDVISQATVLLNIHSSFGRLSSGIDLTAIGGAGKAAATVSFSSTMSNWKKNYSDVRLVEMSPSGIWEQQSDNLLNLL